MTEFDLSRDSVRDLNQGLHDSAEGRWLVSHPDGRHCVAVGLDAPVEVDIKGHVGYYCAGMNKRASITIDGSAGPGVAENMMSGTVRVLGNVSHCAGASGHGGLLVVEGDASARCGISMKGSDIVVAGSVGHMSAFMAQAGRLVVCGDAGDFLGDSIYEAVIYVAGKVGELGADCIEKEMTPEHRQGLADLLSAAAVDADPDGFRRYGSARKLYNFNIDHASDY
jgi:glutamate synthase domain-containing protein 3